MTAVVEVANLSKRFRLPLDRSTTLKYRVTHWRAASRYRDFYALRDVSFDVASGQFLGIAGPNGCGKSTLLKILTRIYEPDGGTARVSGDVSAFLELGVGFNPELTARENIFLGGAVLGLTRSQLTDRVDGILHFAELEDFADQKLKNFSSGMQVRLAFTVAILARSDLLIMDEVLAVGDAAFQAKCFDIFARNKREGKTIVLVSHDLGALEQYCDRALLLDHGTVVADGIPSEVAALYRRMSAEQADAAESGDAVAAQVPGRLRWGTREVEVTGAAMLDARGERRTRFDTGARMTIHIDLHVHKAVNDIVCGFAIRRADGLLVAGTNTHVDGVRVACPAIGTSSSITYAMDSVPLLAGGYVLEVAIVDAESRHEYDHLAEAAAFHMTDVIGHTGLLDSRGCWTVGP